MSVLVRSILVAALILFVGCNGKIGNQTSEAADAGDVHDSGPSADAGVSADAMASGDAMAAADAMASDAALLDDGGIGDGCAYVSGHYTAGAGFCESIIISCPDTITIADCSTACPKVSNGSSFIPATKCDSVTTDAGPGQVQINCRSPECQG